MLAAHLGFFMGERRVKVKISHVSFPSFWSNFSLLTTKLSPGLSGKPVHLVSAVKPLFKSAFILKYKANSWAFWSLADIRPMPCE